MNETALLILELVAGAGLGVIFFGGLWWTVRRGVSSPRPVLWFVLSLILRTGLVGFGFYLLTRGDWRRAIVCLLGFFLARILVLRLVRRPGAPPGALTPGAPS